MQNDATTAIPAKSIEKIIELSKHKVEILDFTQLAQAAPAEKKEEPKKAAQAKKVEDTKKEDAH